MQQNQIQHLQKPQREDNFPLADGDAFRPSTGSSVTSLATMGSIRSNAVWLETYPQIYPTPPQPSRTPNVNRSLESDLASYGMQSVKSQRSHIKQSSPQISGLNVAPSNGGGRIRSPHAPFASQTKSVSISQRDYQRLHQVKITAANETSDNSMCFVLG